MKDLCISPQTIADYIRLSIERTHRILGIMQASGLIDGGGADRRIRLNSRQVFIAMLTADCVRFGMKVPLATSIVLRIAEALAFDPDAKNVVIQFHAIGASFTFTSDNAPDAASAAGNARFRLTFNLGEYWSAVRAAMTDRADETADRDAA